MFTMTKNLPKHSIFIVSFLFGIFFLLLSFPIINYLNSRGLIGRQVVGPSPVQDFATVLGDKDKQWLYFTSPHDEFSYDDTLMSFSAADESAIFLHSSPEAGELELNIYRANEEILLDRFVYNKEYQFSGQKPDVGQLEKVGVVKEVFTAKANSESREELIALPLEGVGIWYLEANFGSSSEMFFVVRSDLGVIAKEGNDELIFWGQRLSTGRSLNEGQISLISLQDEPKEISTASFDSQGIAKISINDNQVVEKMAAVLVRQEDDFAIVPLNMNFLERPDLDLYYQPISSLRSSKPKVFVFTDRPLYQPGDTVYFKAIIRDDDDARYTIPTRPVVVSLSENRWFDEEPIFQKSYSPSSEGTINGQYQIPLDSKTGLYRLDISLPNSEGERLYSGTDSVYFDVQFFRKPEYSISIETSSQKAIRGDQVSFSVSGQYFFGQPLANQPVKFTVYSEGKELFGKKIFLDDQGRDTVELDTNELPNDGKTKTLAVEVVVQEETGTPTLDRLNVLLEAAEYDVYRNKDDDRWSFYGRIDKKFYLPIKLKRIAANAKIDSVKLSATIKRRTYVRVQEEGKKYPTFRVEEEELPPVSIKTDNEGYGLIEFTPEKIGYYDITISGDDNRGNFSQSKFYFYVGDGDQPVYTADNKDNLTIIVDKEGYFSSDTVRLQILSAVPDRDILLSFERDRVDRFQVVSLTGTQATVSVPLVSSDLPNIYANAVSFSDYYLDSATINIPLLVEEEKKLEISLTPNSDSFGPGETVTVDLLVTDTAGNPVSAEVALFSVDKALFELSNRRIGDVFAHFWQKRYHHTRQFHSLRGVSLYGSGAEKGGCFVKGTQVVMANGRHKNIEDIEVGDYILTRHKDTAVPVRARVIGTHQADADGYLTINGQIKVTANHRIWVNGGWQEAGTVQPGDYLMNQQGNWIRVSSIEWQRGKARVYNLAVYEHNSYFADGVLVHNSKGEERSIFKDTAYWNPTILTDSSGRAQVSFQLPDNLTTWVLSAVAASRDTMVGQNTTDITITKDVVVRPILPEILRSGDKIVLSALVHNFTDSDQVFDLEFTFDGGKVERPLIANTEIASGQMEQFYWSVFPDQVTDEAKITIKAQSQTDPALSDIVVQTIPVWEFGFWEKRLSFAEGEKSFLVNLSPDSDPEKSTINLTVSSTILGSLPTIMNYLVDYPYGCTEQTVSRLVPAIITQENPLLFASVAKEKDIDDIIKTGIIHLIRLQQGNGGWGWWSSGPAKPFLTAYVTEALLSLQDLDFEVNPIMLSDLEGFWQRIDEEDQESKVLKAYAMARLGKEEKILISDFDNLSPDFLALAVMANYLNGDHQSATNGLDRLTALAKRQEDIVFWSAGDSTNFGSQSVSTALALRAIVLAQGDSDLALGAVRYLVSARPNQYWWSTFAAAQTVQSLVDFLTVNGEAAPDYSYQVLFTDDDELLGQGQMNSGLDSESQTIEIPLDELNQTPREIKVAKSGTGQIYSNLEISEFRTDRQAGPVVNGLAIEREYVNEKGKQYSLAVGDTVLVKLIVDSFDLEEQYLVIEDHLPSGLVPVNLRFKNEKYHSDDADYYWNQEITQNGIIIPISYFPAGKNEFTYLARVVSQGEFVAPPATVSLMYHPEINGRTGVQTVVTKQESDVSIFDKASEVADYGSMLAVLRWLFVISLAIFGVAVFFLRKKDLILKKLDSRLGQLNFGAGLVFLFSFVWLVRLSIGLVFLLEMKPLATILVGIIGIAHLFGLLVGIFYLVIRRLNDIGGSRWWAVFLLLPLFNVFGVLILLVMRGEKEVNQYGQPDPGFNCKKILGIE